MIYFLKVNHLKKYLIERDTERKTQSETPEHCSALDHGGIGD